MIDQLLDMTGKVVLITGATKGLGYASAKLMASYGADIVVVSEVAQDCDDVAKEIQEMGRRALSVPADVREVAQCVACVQTAVKEFGRIDVLFNNAGIGSNEYFAQMTEEEYDTVVDTDLKGVYFIGREVAKAMITKKSGVIINMSSLAGVVATSKLTPYMASKAGVIHLTTGMALELARSGIRVNCVVPGFAVSEITKPYFLEENKEIYRILMEKVPMRRIADADEIAQCVLFLASDASSYMTGATLLADGGRHLL